MEFWYEFGSTYSYPPVHAHRAAGEEAGASSVRWRPFLLGPIFQTQGWNDLPFNIFAAKGRYMWRDLTRICEAEGTAAQAAAGEVPAERAEGGEARARRRESGLDALPSPAPCSRRTMPGKRTSARTRRLARYSMRSGVDVEAALAVANTPENKDALRRQTEEAASRGLFGAPSFTIGDELFWGNDRLEAALAWAQP